ncbi:MAG: MarR family transcriptional regulator [Alphaproteobacteria bacterium]|nr:MarR family transcriptional regulator [Alphaproteobacteria bacterium]MBF0249793.1 MarR family transcriptional regulator [Alphaproteobacteria bacterium]
MSTDREKTPANVVNHLARVMTQALNDQLKAHGVAPGQMPVLMCLWEQDGLTQRELYERVKIEQATMSNTLKRMERDCLIYREPDPNDRRSMRIHLTGMARQLEDDITAKAKQVNKAAFDGIKKKERKQVLDLLGRMIENLETLRQD